MWAGQVGVSWLYVGSGVRACSRGRWSCSHGELMRSLLSPSSISKARTWCDAAGKSQQKNVKRRRTRGGVGLAQARGAEHACPMHELGSQNMVLLGLVNGMFGLDDGLGRWALSWAQIGQKALGPINKKTKSK